MAIVGAIIGGSTNALAIRMLFRPYEAKYIGKWRLPFTPGLIPKRREELAKQVGLLVVNHLLTPETVQEKLKEGKIYKELNEFVAAKCKSFLRTEKPMSRFVERLGLNQIVTLTDKTIQQRVYEQFMGWKKANEQKSLNELLPDSIWEKLDEKVPQLTEYLLSHVKVYLLSPRGHELLKTHIDRFFEGRGLLVGMIQTFLDNRNLIDRLQQELVKILNQEETKAAIHQVLQEEVEKLKQMPLSACLTVLDIHVEEIIAEHIEKQTPVKSFLQKPVSSVVSKDMEERIVAEYVPNLLQHAIDTSIRFIEPLMKKLDIPELIRKQVDTFSTEMLEEIVLSITKRELKMITYLGAYIGGFIGVFQGIIVIFFNQ